MSPTMERSKKQQISSLGIGTQGVSTGIREEQTFVLAISRYRKGRLKSHSFLAPNSCAVPGDHGILFPLGHCIQQLRTGPKLTLTP